MCGLAPQTPILAVAIITTSERAATTLQTGKFGPRGSGERQVAR